MNSRSLMNKVLRAGIPVVAFLLFASVAIVSTLQATRTQTSLDTLRSNVLGQSVTSNDSSVASSIVAYQLSEYLRGGNVEPELRRRMNVLNTQLRLGQSNFEGRAVDHITAAKVSWDEIKPGINSIIDGNRDPVLVSEVFTGLDQTRIHAKQAADSWLNDVLAKNLIDTQDHLLDQQRLFSLFAPIAALGAIIVVGLTLRSRQRAKLEYEIDQLSKINNEKTQFVTQVSHELKTPLTSVIAFTDLLIGKSDVPLSIRQSGHLKVVKRNAEYLKLLVNDLIDVSQLETGHIAVDPKPIQLNTMLTELQTSFGPIVERKHQKLVVTEVGQSLSVDGDHLRLLQVFSNLVGNAMKYSEVGTTVTVSTRTYVDSVRICVEDEGEGIPDADKKRVFEMFYRGSTESAARNSGTGIGLAVSKLIIDAHKGSIVIEDGEPIGTRVVVRLPRIVPAQNAGIKSLFVA